MFNQFKKPQIEVSGAVEREIRLLQLSSEYHIKRAHSLRLEAEREEAVRLFQEAMANSPERLAAKIAIEKSEKAREELAIINAKILEIEERKSKEYRQKNKL